MSKQVKLEEIASFQTGPFGTQLKASEYSITGTPIINVKNIGYGNLILDDMDYVPEEVCLRLSNHLLQEGDIVFGRKGSVDRHCYIKKENENWMQGSDCIRMRLVDGINSRYVSYYLMLNHVKSKINNSAVGSTMASINTDILKSIEITLPELERQELIVEILEKIDKKIENNNKVNAELESMAKTVYDYWFLQFEFPNEEGRPYKSSGGKMVWNEELKREIPEGWEVKELKDIVDITMGTSPKGNTININGDGIVFYQGKADFGSRFPIVRTYTREPIRYAEKNDVLLSVRAPVGALNIADKRCCIGRGLAAIHSEYTSFVFYFLLASQFRFDIYNNGGTTFGAITRDDLFKMRMLISPQNIIKKFEEKVNYIDRKISNNSNEIKELMSLRDYLLPLLMNGQISFKA